MKKIILILCIFSIVAAIAFTQDNAAIRTIIHHYSARNFLSGAISQSDLDKIVQAAVNTPSARNQQPWHFTIVTNTNLAKRIISNVNDGNVLFVISAAGEDGKVRSDFILDCALAAQTVYLAAQALGLGSRIYTGPVNDVNKDLKSALSLPRGHSVVVIVRIGKVPPIDAISAASARNKPESMVTYKK